MRYDPSHNYELKPLVAQNPSSVAASAQTNSNSTNELIKLKGLLDQGAITNDDFTNSEGEDP